MMRRIMAWVVGFVAVAGATAAEPRDFSELFAALRDLGLPDAAGGRYALVEVHGPVERVPVSMPSLSGDARLRGNAFVIPRGEHEATVIAGTSTYQVTDLPPAPGVEGASLMKVRRAGAPAVQYGDLEDVLEEDVVRGDAHFWRQVDAIAEGEDGSLEGAVLLLRVVQPGVEAPAETVAGEKFGVIW